MAGTDARPLQTALGRAGGTEAANFDGGLFRLELAVLHPALKAMVDLVIVELGHLPAGSQMANATVP